MTSCKQYMDELAKTCKEKGYDKEFFSIITIICCSTQMHKAGYTSESALQKAIKFVKEEQKQVYTKLLELTGYKSE